MKKIREEAKTILKELANKVISIVNLKKPEYVTEEIYWRYIPKEIKRDEHGIVTSCSWELEFFTKKSYSKVINLITKYKNNEEFIVILENLSKIFNITIERVENHLTSFVHKIVINALSSNDIDQVLDDLEGIPHSCTLIAKMKGIVPKNTEFIINNNIEIKKIQERDLTLETLPYQESLKDVFFGKIPHSIMEIHFQEGRMPYIQHRFDEITVLLSLYRVSAISYQSYSIKTKSFNPLFHGTLTRGKSVSNQPLLILTKQDEFPINIFFNICLPLISNLNIKDEPRTHLGISLRRYLDSILMIGKIDEKILNTIMGLEALFLTRQPEARFRLAIRAAQVLGNLNEDSLKVYSSILKAYEYRSAYVHGSMIKNKEQEKAKILLVEIRRYLRKAFLLYLLLELNSKRSKKKFLRQIDLSLISEDEFIILKNNIDIVKKSLPNAF